MLIICSKPSARPKSKTVFSKQEMRELIGLHFGHEIWDSTIKPADLALYGWDANPWVRVIEFELLPDPPSGFYGADGMGG